MIVITNRIPVAQGHEIDFEDRFKNRAHLVDRAPGFIRNEVHRPRPVKFSHEAEFAAGFLDEAGIPYRLQHDDAGGADLGLSMLHPSVVWVRAVDADVARELLALERDDDTEEFATMPAPKRPDRVTSSPLTLLERAVSGGLAVTLLAVAPNLPPMPLRGSAVLLCFVAGAAFGLAALVGRAPGPLGELVRMISGSPPQ